MANGVNFRKEIESLEKEIATAESELSVLIERRKAYDGEVAELRASLDELKMVMNGELPSSAKGRRLKPVPRKKGSDRPKRGARKTQIINICRSLGRSGETFRTKAVLEELRRIEDDVSEGIRSYTYSLMDKLEDEGVISKVGRGTWALQ